MTRLLELVEQLNETDREKVKDFAEFLLSRQARPQEAPREEYLDVDAIAGTFAGLAPEKSAVELAHEATEARAAKPMK
jgi:hypothetical protein